jgi:WD40 repeat protein
MLKKVLFLCLTILFFSTAIFSQTVANEDVAVKLYSLPEFRDVSVWKGRTGLTLFSPNLKLLAVSAKSADVVIYDTITGKAKTQIDGKGFRAFSFSPDSKYVVAQDTNDLSMKIFEVETGKLVRSIRGLGSLTDFNRSVGGSGMVNSFNGIYIETPLEMERIPVSSDWKSILVNKNDKEFLLFDYESGNEKFELKHENYSSGKETAKTVFAILGGVEDLLGSASNTEFSQDGKLLFIANGNKTPTVWNVETGKLVAKFDAGERVFYGQISPNGKMLATTDFRQITKIWDIEKGSLLATIGSKKEGQRIIAWSSDSEKVFVNPDKGDLKAFEAKSGTMLYSFDKSNSYGVLLSNDKKSLVTVPRKDKTILYQIWNAETGKLLATVPREAKKDSISALKWSPSDKMILTVAGLKNEIEIWNLYGEKLQTLKNSTFPMQFSPDEKLLVTGGKVENSQTDTGYLWAIIQKQ